MKREYDFDTEPRNHDWLMRFAAREIKLCPRVKRYMQGLLAVDRPLRLKELVDVLPSNPVSHGEGGNRNAYHISRGGAALIGRKAFLFRTPGTPLHGRAEVFDEAVEGLRLFRRRQQRNGDFAWGDAWSGNALPHHSHAWRLEPLIWARVWLDADLSGAQKSWIDAMIERGARRQLWFARTAPNDTLQYCNRGVVWSAVTTLCGLFLDDPEYQREVERHAGRILTNTIGPDGAVLENYLHYAGGGPDMGYSLTTWQYAVMYRLLSGRRDLDDLLLRAQKWSLLQIAHSGVPLAPGASVRYAAGNRAWVTNLLPGCEFFADREPYFDVLADRLLGRGVEHGQGHTVHPFIWGAYLHRPRRTPAQPPSWFTRHETREQYPPCEYSIIHHRYQTAVTWRSLFPMNGLQTFALEEDEPIIQPQPGIVSETRCGAQSTARQNISVGRCGWELFRRNAGPGNGYEPESPVTFMTARRGKLWECFVFTPASVVVAVGSQKGALRTRWVLNETGGAARLDVRKKEVRFVNRRARIVFLSDRAALRRPKGATLLEVSCASGPSIFGLGGPDLALNRYDPRSRLLTFRDASGRYTLSLADILDQSGDVNQSPEHWGRVQRLGGR